MPRNLFVVNNPDRWPLRLPEVEVVAARTYLSDSSYSTLRNCRVYNLCRSYKYQSLGYYVSLLAEAREHKPIPRISTIQDIKIQSLMRVFSSDLEGLIQKTLHHLQGDEFSLSIYFARNLARHYDRLARELFNLFPAPLMRASFVRGPDGWEMKNITPISTIAIPANHRQFAIDAAREHFGKRRSPARRSAPRYGVAILADPKDPTPPSDAKALERFARAMEKLSCSVDFIDRDDYGRLAEYDALFIRSTTAVNDYTYRFARRAEAEGLVVIDDPDSIVKCTNKVFLAELLNRHHISTPRTEIVHEDNRETVLKSLGLPLILKQPDSSYSQGVCKVESEEEYRQTIEELLEKSDLLIAQEFLRTKFDWRIGILDQRPLYACQYFMARNHWQIYNTKVAGDDHTGTCKTVPVETAPARVVRTALRAANLIGNGFYGVDMKETESGCCVIEVNDNPSIDSGVEDRILRGFLYERVAESFCRRLDAQRDARSNS